MHGLLLTALILSASTARPTPDKSAAVLATLQRTVCFGTCPAYTLTIHADGRVDWLGQAWVDTKGPATAQLSAKQLDALRAAFADADYFDLKENYDCYEMTDMPKAITSFDDGHRSRKIVHYYGCRTPKGAKELTELESKIDEIVGTQKWIGRRKSR